MTNLPTDSKNDWMPLGTDVFYRRHSLYLVSFLRDYNVSLSNFKVVPNYYGGSILMTSDPNKGSSIKGDVVIYSSSGSFISIIRGIAKSAVHCFLTLTEDIVTVTFDGKITIYDITGRPLTDKILDHDIRSAGISDCKHYPSSVGSIGLAILTSSNQFYIIDDVYAPVVIKLANFTIPRTPATWCVISFDETPTTVIASKDDSPGSVILLSKFLSIQVQLEFPSSSSRTTSSPSFTSASVDQSNIGFVHQVSSCILSNKVALLTDTGLMWIGCLEGNSSLIRSAEFNTKSKSKANQFVWAGEDAVVAVWKEILLAIGVDSSYFSFKIDLPAVLAEEPDGLRIITNFSHDLLQRIPKIVVSTKNVGSITDGANLLEAGRQFKAHTQKADIYLRILRDQKQMENAVSECIISAGHEYVACDQKTLLETAHLGKVFTSLINPSLSSCPASEESKFHRDEFLNMCKILRVLNTVRTPQIGYPMTYEQCNRLGLNGLISRLINRKFYANATSIANFMKVPPVIGSLKILTAWAHEKVLEHESEDEVVASKIYSKLGPSPGISYADIAGKAISCGRKKLAIALLDYEVKSSSQVKLLLDLEQYQAAIEKSEISGDQQLLVAMLSTIKCKYGPQESFHMMLRSSPFAYITYKLMAQRQEQFELLRNLLHRESSHLIEGLQWLDEYYRICNDLNQSTVNGPSQMNACLKSSLEYLKKAKYDFGVSVIESQMKLHNLHKRLKAKRTSELIGSSLNETLKTLILLKDHATIAEIKKEHRVSDKRFWHVKVLTCSQAGDWMELEKLSRSKKVSPIGYEAFADACVKYGNRNEAIKYARKISDHESKLRSMVKIGFLEEAAEAAFDRNDIAGLDYVLSHSGPTLKARMMPLRQRLISSNHTRS